MLQPAPQPAESTSSLRFDLALQRSRLAVYSVAFPLSLLFTLTGFNRITLLQATVTWATASASALLFSALYRRGLDRRLGVDLRPFWMGTDVLLVTLVLYFDGGEHSLWFILYLAGVAAAAFASGRRGAYLDMAACAAAYLALLVGMGQVRAPDQHLVNALARLGVLFGSAFFSIRGIADLEGKRALIERLRALDQDKLEALTRLTAELEERSRQLAEKGRQLETASRLKSEFLAAVSHELRTPMNSIIGFTQILQRRLGDVVGEKERKFLHNVLASANHLLGLINSLLDLSRIEAGKMEVFPEPVRLGEVCRETVDELRPAAEAKGVRLALEAGGEVPAVITDRARVKQVLLELGANAVKFSPAGASVTLRLAAVGPDQPPLGCEAVRVDVVDTGPGIARADQELVFEAFRQLHGGLDRPAEGAGLGLALVRKTLDLLGGAVALDSEPGRGSTFSVFVPVAAPASSGARLAVSPVPAAMSAAARPRVLVVEDDPNAAQLLALTLRAAGYETEQVRRGEDALGRVERDPPALITLDLLLPGVDGWEVLRRLRQHPSTRGIPVVVVSQVADRELAATLGVDEFFVKPVAEEALVRRVGELVAPAGGGVPAPPTA